MKNNYVSYSFFSVFPPIHPNPQIPISNENPRMMRKNFKSHAKVIEVPRKEKKHKS